MSAFWTITGAVIRRNVRNLLGSPSLLIPPLIAPLVFYAAFAGGLSGIGNAPGFDYPGGYTTFQFVFVFLQSMVFNGAISGFAMARDFDSGFMRRLMLSASRHDAVVAGYAATGIMRAALTGSVLFGIGLATGIDVHGGALDLLAFALLSLAVTLVGTLWGNGMALRFRTQESAPLIQVPIFLLLFLAPVFAPLELITGWLEPTAKANPFTVFLQATRSWVAGGDADVVRVTAAAVTLAGSLFVFLTASLRRAQQSPP